MSTTVIEQPRNDVPIVADATLLAVPNPNDETARAEYLKRIRALRNQPSEGAEPTPQPQVVQPETVETDSVEEPVADAIERPNETAAERRIRLSKEDLREYEIPVTDENGNIQYLSYDEFDKTVGLYSKQNKRARELADREKEIEALKSTLLAEQNAVLQRNASTEVKMAERYQWVQNSLAFAHKHNLEVIQFDDGTSKKVTQLIAEKTALENDYVKLQQERAKAQETISRAQNDFVAKQNAILEERAPGVVKNRSEVTKFLEQNGFTSEEAKILVHGKAELLLMLDKAMRYENAQRGTVKEKKVSSNTKVLKQPSRLAGRGTTVITGVSSRMQELQAKGTRASPDELRELRKLQLQNR